jgi:hypothetical protein
MIMMMMLAMSMTTTVVATATEKLTGLLGQMALLGAPWRA